MVGMGCWFLVYVSVFSVLYVFIFCFASPLSPSVVGETLIFSL